MRLDSQGRTATERLGVAKLQSRDVSELVGICKGVLADGAINLQEAAFILSWLDGHQSVSNLWPADYLCETLSKVLEDGRLSSADEGELLDVLVAITGAPIRIELSVVSDTGEKIQTVERTLNTSATLSINEPGDGMIFNGCCIVLTGNFLFGTRKECEEAVRMIGGTPQKRVTRSTNYLVIGEIGSESWAHSSFGRRIE